MPRPAAVLSAALFTGFSTLFAAGVSPEVKYHFDPDGFRGDSTRLIARVSIPEGWHIQSNAPLDSFLIPTVLRAEGEGLVFGKPVYPKPMLHDFPALGGKVAVFEGIFEIGMLVKKATPKTRSEALKSAKVALRYQACNNTQCLPPKEVTARLDTSAKGGLLDDRSSLEKQQRSPSSPKGVSR